MSTLLKNKRILLVDDEEVIREVLRQVLERQGGIVEECHSGDSAYEFLKANPVDIVVSDLRMAKGDGLQLAYRAREAFGPELIFAICTGYGDFRASETERLRIDVIFQKPFTAEEIVDSLSALLRARSQAA